MKKFLTVNQYKVSYFEVNPSSSKTIFFLHDATDTSTQWSHQFSDQLFSNYRLVAFNLPTPLTSKIQGHNEASDYAFYSSLLVRALQECIQNDNYILVAFKGGASLVAQMLTYNVYPKGIVLINPVTGLATAKGYIGKYDTDIELLRTNAGMPLLVICGASALHDNVCNQYKALHLWQEQIAVVTCNNDSVQIEEADAVNKMISAYCGSFFS